MPKAADQGNESGKTFIERVNSQEPVAGFTHRFYRYPARFSPLFARAAIEKFTKPGDTVLDPFMGGGTTLVEALTLGRNAIGSDINSLARFVARLKTTTLSENDLDAVTAWANNLPEAMNVHAAPKRAEEWDKYQVNVPWRHRKIIELALVSVGTLKLERQQRFARGLLLKLGQLALDCKQTTPTVQKFRDEVAVYLEQFAEGMREFRTAVFENRLPDGRKPATVCIQKKASELGSLTFDAVPKLVVTSPPYPGVYVLYHRWKVRGRKESPAPYWLADCQDGQGHAHYCFGDRRKDGLPEYFDGIRESFEGIRQVIAKDALVVQMVSFKEPDWQIPAYLESMNLAGFNEVMPSDIGVPVEGRQWRPVPGRRWFALIQGDLSTSQELVLFHKPK